MSELSKYQRSRQQVQEMMDHIMQQVRSATCNNDYFKLKTLTEQLAKLEKTIQLIDSRLTCL